MLATLSASERLHLSQLGMSNALGRLREYFEDELLVQVGRQMEPTPRGEILREAVSEVLLRINTTVAALPEFDPAISDREFTLFISDYSMEVFIPHAIALASKQRSKVRFKLLPQSMQPSRSLERGEADVLIIPSTYVSPKHPSEIIFKEEFVCAIWRDSLLARGEMTTERYVNAGHVVMQPIQAAQPAFEDWFIQSHGISRQIQVSTYCFSAMPFLFVGTELIATVHARLARQLQISLPIKLVPVPPSMPLLEQTMQWQKYQSQDPGLV